MAEALSILPRVQDLPEAWRDLVVFEVRGRPKTLLDTVRAALWRGELLDAVAASRRAQACESLAAMRELEPDLAPIETALDQFRYGRALETVEDTERWLGARGLPTDSMVEYFCREYWAATLGADPSLPPHDPEWPAVWPADLVFSGALFRFARTLAWETVCAAQAPALGSGEGAELFERLATRLGIGASEARACCADWETSWEEAAQVAFLAAWAEKSQQEILTPGARARLLTEQRTLLLQVELEVVSFDQADAAREAFQCVTADHVELSTVAAETGYPIERRVALVRDLPETWRLPVLGASPGRTLPPLPGAATYEVVRVLRHLEPSLEDPAIVAALDAVLLRRHFGDTEILQVRWRIEDWEPK